MTDLLAQVWALIADEPVARPDLGTTEAYLHALCDAAVRALPVDGASLTVMAGENARGLVITSDRTSQRMAEMQTTLGEGPGIDAHALSRPVLESNLNDAGLIRWPSFARAALEVDIQAVFALPLQIGAARMGVLDLHRLAAVPLAPHALRQALTFAEVAVLTLLDGHWAVDGERGPRAVEQAMSVQSVLYQAQGMVKVQLGVTLGEAMARLRAYAYAHDQPLAEVAADVVARRIRLARDL